MSAPKPQSDPHAENALLCACQRKEQLVCPCGAKHYMERQNLEEQLQELHAAATPFGHMAQEMLTGHPTGHLPKGAPERLLAALKVVDGA